MARLRDKLAFAVAVVREPGGVWLRAERPDGLGGVRRRGLCEARAEAVRGGLGDAPDGGEGRVRVEVGEEVMLSGARGDAEKGGEMAEGDCCGLHCD